MIIDLLSNSQRYFTLHREFENAFTFIQRYTHFEPDRLHLPGSDMIAIIELAQGKSRSGARLEVHRKYIDIQYVFEGHEEIGWKPLKNCLSCSQPYHEEKDIQFFSDSPLVWTSLEKGFFAIFFPEDAHAPLASNSEVKKIIIKVPV